MAMRHLADMAHSDDEIYDMSKGMPKDYDPPMYPSRLMFYLKGDDIATAGIDGGEPGHTMRFSAMGEVTSVFKSMTDCRIEVSLTEFAGDDGKFFDLDQPAAICLCGPDMEKMDLDDDCERGDTIHLIGTLRMESSMSHEMGDSYALQIVELTFEDESNESREGGDDE
jgi:hypothetical protein